ncbi:RHS repeat-associated core domain-containing protein [Kitasatospora sp. NPDC088351]|uniref:RHS repeat-associated core domain-containing protein n=1 Tax=Kitasatospora sp. NPDC088351 TaxID=3155180 RepID=UPI003419CD8F
MSIDLTTSATTRRPTDAFGNPRGNQPTPGTWLGDKGYVDGTKDDTTGLTNLGARQCQPATGRFISADPVILSEDPQQWNAYAYSNNNPVDKVDASGLALQECASGMYKCENNGTKVVGEGVNYAKITSEIKKDEPRRQAALKRLQLSGSPFSLSCAQCFNYSGPSNFKLPGASGTPSSSNKSGIIKDAPGGNDEMGSFRLLINWATSATDRNLQFGGGSAMVGELAKHNTVNTARAQLVAGVTTGAPDAMDPVTIRYKDEGPAPGTLLNSIRGAVSDVLGTVTHGRHGTSNYAAAVLGSYSGGAWVKEVDTENNLVRIHFDIRNISGWNSATHVIPRSWENWIGWPLPGESIYERFAWDEYWPINQCADYMAYLR